VGAIAEDLELIPGGLEPPEDIPPEVFAAALEAFLGMRRLDMRALAGELGISRATLYRRVDGRDHLLGQVVWFLTRHAMTRALDSAGRQRGSRRVLSVVEHFMRDVNSQPAFRRFLDAEPEAALRILTSKHGGIQQGISDVLEKVLEQEEAAERLELGIDRATLAYVIVRIGESFLYADVIADNEPDVGQAVAVIGKLLR
jgi:AcrR family transcriptional regulator